MALRSVQLTTQEVKVGDWAWITMNSGWDEWIEPMFKATLELLGFCERAA